MSNSEVDFSDWFQKSKSILIGQDFLLQEIILKFMQKRANIPGFHGIILDGATGSGKSALGHALRETCPFESVFKDCIEIFINSKIGGSERELQKLFTIQTDTSPKLIILDNAESVFSQKDSSDSEKSGFSNEPITLERKIFLLAKHLIDKIGRDSTCPVFLIAILPDRKVLPAEIRIPGRLNYSFNVNLSKSEQREDLLRVFLKDWRFESEEEKNNCIKILSGQPTSGFTPADLECFLQRTLEFKSEKAGFVTLNDFLKARHFVNPASIVARLTKIQPSNVDIIGLDKQMETIKQYMSAIFRNDKTVPLPRGILLEGPSGCGKSLLAARLSNIPFKIGENDVSFPVNFIAIDSTQIISKYFGQSDRNLSQIFNEARLAAPCILFFDQIDTLVGRRSLGGSGSGGSDDRLVTTFLIEMDGLKSKMSLSEGNSTVIVLGTTSKKHLIDPAILRPGRLDLHVNIPLPDLSARSDFINKFMSRAKGKYHLTPENISVILAETEGKSFAELDSIFKEAAMTALREDIDCLGVEFSHFKLN